MSVVRQSSRSPWMEMLPQAAPPLTEALHADVAVIGAGIAGLTAAYLLQQAGRSVVVIDNGPAAGGMTGRTTAHLTFVLDDRWADLIDLLDEERARLALDSHRAAVAKIEAIQKRESIDCDFARVDGFLFLAPGDDFKILEREHAAAARLGLACEWEARAPLTGHNTGRCLRFPDQGRFHPLKYVAGLMRCIERDGGRFVTAHVTGVEDGTPVRVVTEAGHDVHADAAVVATNTPINDRLVVHTKQAPYRTYVIAGRIPSGALADALIWDTGDPYHYVRIQPALDATHDLLIVGGEDHKSGQAHDMQERFDALEAWTRRHVPAFEHADFCWSGQVMEPVDFLGYHGRNPGERNVYVASGDSGMGMTHGTLGAMIISDLIAGHANGWAALYDPARKTLGAIGEYTRENLNAVATLSAYATAGDIASPEALAPGEGAVIRSGLRKLAAYRDPQGAVHLKSAVCTHAGCIVQWNPLERCWDCPCHGSQFDVDGRPMNGPAVTPLADVNATSRRASSEPARSDRSETAPHSPARDRGR
jgi:glycine/D-amino acid oxidase-like deaminating enzyme/nitrite reductase/ring-hydroxylating ferredoxin subunit